MTKYLSTHKSDITPNAVVPENIIESESVIFHKINHRITNLEFDKALHLVPSLSSELQHLKYKIKTASKFYTDYNIAYNTSNLQLVQKLQAEHYSHYIQTTQCNHGILMAHCYKCC